MGLDEKKRNALDKVFNTENTGSVNFWKPSSDVADAKEWNANIERDIAEAEQSDRFKDDRTREQRVSFLKGARVPVPARYVSGLSNDKRALLDKAFGLNTGKPQVVSPIAAPVSAAPEMVAPTSSLLPFEVSEKKKPETEEAAVSAPADKTEQRMPVERFDVRGILNTAPVRSGVLLDPERSEAPATGDMVLPSGTVLRKSDRDLDEFFRDQVMPGIEPVQAAADERARKTLTEQGRARDRRWLEHFNIDPVGDYVADAVQMAATSRRERGPARIVEEVLSGIDPAKANAYIADRLADDPEFAAAAERLQKAVPAIGDVSEQEVEQLQAALSPVQRKQYDKAVAEEQKRIVGEQEAFQKAADAAWKRQAQQFQQGITGRLVEEMARRNMPESELETFARIALNASVPGMLAEWTVSNATGGDKALHAQIMQRALEKYNPSIWTRMGGDVAGLLSSGPVFAAGGALGKAGAAVLRRAAERNVMKRLMARGITEGAEGVARRLVAGSMAQRLAQGLVASGTTLGTYDAVATPLAMAAAGEKPSFWDVLGATVRGFATGALLPGIGMATGRVADAATSRLGRYAAELGGFAAENAAFVGMGTLYDGLRTGEWGSPEQLAEDFAHSVGVLGIMKSVGALKRGRTKNPGFYDKVIAETEFTPEEVDALGRAGVDGRSYKRAVFDLLNAKETASEREVAERAAEQLGSRYADVMRSPEVPVSAKAKLMYLVEGRIPERLPLTTDVRRSVGEDGRTTVDLLDPAGNLVQRRTFATEKAAEAFERESAGVREVNSIQYYETLIDRVQALDEASQAYATERGVPVEAVKNEVRKAVEGQPYDRELVRQVVELSGQVDAGTLDVPGMLAAEIGRKYGLREGGFEQALSRREKVRTPEERAAVAEYAARLKQIAVQELRPEPTPEQRAERQLVEMAEQEIAQAKNRDDGVVYTATMQDGRQANIIKGANLVYDPETGEVDVVQSDPTVVVRYEDGTMHQISVREIDMIVEAVSAEDVRSEALKAIREQLDAAAREEALAEAVETGGLVQLKDGRIGAVEGVNEDGSYNMAVQDGGGRIVTEQVAAGEIVGPVEEESIPETVGSSEEAVPAAADETEIPEETQEQAAGPEIPRLKNGQPDFNAMQADMLALELSAAVGHDKAVERLQVARGVNAKNMEKLRKSLDGMGDLNKAMAVEQQIAAMQQEDARLAGALEQLGVVEEPVTGKAPAENFSKEIERLFPEGLPNVRARVLADIARGQRFVWNDSPDGTKRGVATELGFAGNESERRARFGMLGSEGTGAKHVSRYVHDLWQDSNGYAFDMDDAALRDEVIDVLLATPSRASAMEQLRDMAARVTEDDAAPRDAEDLAAIEAYEKERKALSKPENNGNFAESAYPETYETATEKFGRDNDERLAGSDSRSVFGDNSGAISGIGDRGDIQVFEKGLGTESYDDSEYSERDRQGAESERLLTVAKTNGLYIDPKEWDSFGGKYPKRTGESVVYINRDRGKIYKIKDPYAKAAIKGNAPEDAIYEHLIHNLLFPETRYTFEGISDHLGDVRIVLSQDYINSFGSPTQKQIDAALAARGLLPEDKYRYGNDLVSVTDVEGDNVLTGNDGQLYFIDPIIKLKKPARQVIDELSAAQREADGGSGPEIGLDDVPFSVVGEASAAPAGVTPERWKVIVDQLRRVIGAENVVTDPAAVRAAYDRITGRGMEIRRQQVAEINERFNEQLERLKGGTLLSGDKIALGNPSAILLACGVNDAEITATQRMLKDHISKHGLSLDDIRNLPAALENPIMVYEWGNKARSTVVITEIPRGNERIAVAIRLKPGRNGIAVNAIASVHGKSADRLLADMNTSLTDFREENLKWVDKEKVLNWIAAGGSFGPSGINQGLVTATNIVTNFENPKIGPENINRSIVADNKMPVEISDRLQVIDLKKNRTDLSRVDNRRFMLNPKTGTLILGDEKYGHGADLVAGSHSEEFFDSGVKENFDDFIRGWIGYTARGRYKNGIIHFAPSISAENFDNGFDAIQFLRAQDGINERTLVRGFGTIGEETIKDLFDPNIRYFRTPEGEVYGFTAGGKIYLDGERMNAATPMHEYTELWSQIVARENPELWMRGVELMKQTFVWDEVNADPNYKELPEELRVSETLSRMVADEFAGKQDAITDSSVLLGKLRAWMRKFWGFLKDTFAKWTKRELDDLTTKKFVQMPLRDFVEGIDLQKVRGPKPEPQRVAGHKQMQLEIIERYNPMRDDVHTGIRNIEDIKSFEEVVNEAKSEGDTAYPDIGLELLEEATKTGRMTVYSSYPIKQGVFVSPSRLNAADYAGGGPVYSKEVSVDDVAWITPDEGQYAKVGSNSEARFSFIGEREFTERKVTTLEKLENKRDALIADRGNIANFDEQLAAVDAEIEAYMQSDPVAETFGKDGASDAHLRAVEDSVYDMQRKFGIDNPVVVARNQAEFVARCRDLGVPETNLRYFEQVNCPNGIRFGDTLLIRANDHRRRIDAEKTLLHERAHFITRYMWMESDAGLGRLYDAATEAGADYMNHRLEQREKSYHVDADDPESMIDGINEMISRNVDILWKKGILQKYVYAEDAGIDVVDDYMSAHNVPGGLKELILFQCKELKDGKAKVQFGKGAESPYSRLFPALGGYAATDVAGRGTDGRGREIARSSVEQGKKRTAGDGNGHLGGGRGGYINLSFPGNENDDMAGFAPKLTKQQQLIADLRRAVRESKASARAVAQIVSRRVRREVGSDLVEIMGKREFDALIRQIEEATARQEVEKPLQRIAEVATDLEIKRLQKVVDDFLKLKVQGKGPRGVSVAKEVDDRTRRMFEIFRNNLDRPAAEVAGELREQEDADTLYDLDAVSALEAYQEAVRYGREVDEIDREVEALRARNTQLRRERIAANKAGHKELFELLKKQILYNNELIDALDAERVETKGHRAGALKETAGLLSGQIGTGREILSEWKEQERERRKKIVKEAFRDVDDGSRIPVLDERPGVWTQGYRRTMDFLLSPAYSMDYLLKTISVNAPKGEGALYDHFMRSADGYVESRGRYYLGYEDFKRALDEKAQAVFGKSYPEVVADSNAPTEATITITNAAPRKPEHDKQKGTDAGNQEMAAVEEAYNPTIGEALYIYMANKMTDGRVKLKRMGIKEEDVVALAGILPARYVQFADWLQNEFLPERRKTYNATHLAVFGTQMARIENYVPLKIQKSYVRQEVDGSEPDPDTLPSAITGSIIKRTRNNQILNLHTNALDLMLEHGQQMEHWNAFTRVVLDMNALLTSTAFRRMLDARNPGLHKRLKVAAQLAADSYRPQANDVNRAWIALGKLAASSKIAFRMNTALKQILSFPAFYAYSANPKFWAMLTKNLAPTTWAKNWRWCIENIPSFRERWLGRMAGNEKLAQMTAPALDKWLDKMNRYGMVSNAFIDALTCANGAKAVYDFQRAEYMERGRDKAEAERLARIDAAVAINETQQSSEGMYIGQMQADRDFWSVSLSTFQNSNFAYLRKMLEGINELFRNADQERRNRAEYYKERGFSEDEAFDQAIKDVAAAKKEAWLNIAVFGFILNIIWGIGNNVWKYLFVPETRDEIPGELAKSAFVAAVRNTTVGSAIESFANGYDANPSVLLSDMIAFTKKLRRIMKEENPDAWNETAAYLALQTISANGLGIDLESFVNMYQGIAGMIRDGVDVEDLMRMLNAPQSQAKLLAGEPKEGETEEEYHERMIFTERRIAERVGKKRRDKWTRNYTAYRQAEALGMRAERDIYGNVTVPELKQLDEEYAEALKNSGVTAAGDMRKDYDWQAMTPEQQERWRRRARKVWKISEEEKDLDEVIVYNERYAERMRQLMERKREYMVDVENNK
jgi:hypothetical protein